MGRGQTRGFPFIKANSKQLRQLKSSPEEQSFQHTFSSCRSIENNSKLYKEGNRQRERASKWFSPVYIPEWIGLLLKLWATLNNHCSNWRIKAAPEQGWRWGLGEADSGLSHQGWQESKRQGALHRKKGILQRFIREIVTDFVLKALEIKINSTSFFCLFF